LLRAEVVALGTVGVVLLDRAGDIKVGLHFRLSHHVLVAGLEHLDFVMLEMRATGGLEERRAEATDLAPQAKQIEAEAFLAIAHMTRLVQQVLGLHHPG